MYPSDIWHYSNYAKKQFSHLGAFIYAVIHGGSVFISVQSPWVPTYNGTKKENIMGLGTLTWTARTFGTLRSKS